MSCIYFSSIVSYIYIRIYHLVAFQHTFFFQAGFKHIDFLFKPAIFLFYDTIFFPHTRCKHTFCYSSIEYTYRSIGEKDFMTMSASIQASEVGTKIGQEKVATILLALNAAYHKKCYTLDAVHLNVLPRHILTQLVSI